MRRLTRTALVALAFSLLTAPPVALAQGADTRAEELRRQREEKAEALTPPNPSAMEKVLLRLENGRLLERLLAPPEGFFPKLGNVSPGSGFAGGLGYRKSRLFGGIADFSSFGAVSTMRYWVLDARVTLPHMAGGHLGVDVYGRRSDFRREQFYGVGPDSQRENQALYALKNTAVGGTVTARATPWLTFSSTTEFFQPRVRGVADDDLSIDARYLPSDAPGLGGQPRFIRQDLTAEANYRMPRGNPRRGGKYAVVLQKYMDQEVGRDSFDRVEVDLQQYVPLLHDRRVLVFRALGSVVPDASDVVPFYLQRTLGGPDDLRGFRRFRFRDENMLLLQAEYRWEIFTAMDGAIFYDRGAVAARPGDLSLSEMDSDYGIGFRFGTATGVFLRVEGAFGSREGKHLVIRYGHVF
jgi:outer membrane protein assembly factor BamA